MVEYRSSTRPPPPLALFHKRALSRLLGEVPEDLAEWENWDVMNVARWRAPAERIIATHRTRESGKPPCWQRPLWLMSLPRSSRRTSWDKRRSFHLRVHPPTPTRDAAEHDRYASGKALLDEGKPAAHDPAQAGRAAAADAYQGTHGARTGESAPASISTLTNDAELRAPDWQAIEKHELTRGLVHKKQRQAGEDRINIKVTRSPTLVRAIIDDPACPESLREVITAEERRLRSQTRLNPRREVVGGAYVAANAKEVSRWITQTDAWRVATKHERGALSLSCARAPRPVVVADLELPAELSDTGCLRVMRQLHAFLEAPDGPTSRPRRAEMKVPVTIAMHHPDRLNDRRNRHLHLVAAKRRFLIKDDGKLARDENGNLIAAARMEKFYWEMGFQKRLREAAARFINAELENERAVTRFHPGRDEELGASGPTMTHLSTAATVLGRAGVPTLARLNNSVIGWSRQFDAVRDQAERDKRQARREVEIARAQTPHEDSILRRDLLRAYHARLKAISAARHADEIELLIAMARSGPEEVARYAPGYAAAAREKGRRFDAEGWEARARLAKAELDRLHRELIEERKAVGGRRAAARAANHFADAIFFRADRDNDYGDAEAEPLGGVAVGPSEQARDANRPLPPHRLVDLIARTPVKLTRIGNNIVVTPEDDPTGIVAGSDLANVQARLTKLEKAQRRELHQIAAYLAKHGQAPEDLSSISSKWLRDAIAKWRPTPVFARLAAQTTREADRLRQAQPGSAGRQIQSRRPPAAPPRPPSASRPTTIIWSENELRLLEAIRLRFRHDRRRIDEARRRALRARAGDERTITPLAARLLKRLADGFDPAAVDPRPTLLGPTRDQEDVVEIKILSQEPLFAARVADAKRRDPKLLAQVDEVLRRKWPTEPGLVTIDRPGSIDFGMPDRSGSAAIARPHDLALWDLQRLKDQIPDLSRDPVSGLIGVYDEHLLSLLRHNHVGIAHPAVQEKLELAFRLQQTRESIFFGRVGSGEVELSFKTEIRYHDLVSEVVVVRANSEDHRYAARRARDERFYIECRRAAAGERPDVARGQPHHVAYRAWRAAAAEPSVAPSIVRQLAVAALADAAQLPAPEVKRVEDFLKSDPKPMGRRDAVLRQAKGGVRPGGIGRDPD